MKYTIFKIVKIEFDGSETVVETTNDEDYAIELLDKYSQQSSDNEYYKIVED